MAAFAGLVSATRRRAPSARAHVDRGQLEREAVALPARGRRDARERVVDRSRGRRCRRAARRCPRPRPSASRVTSTVSGPQPGASSTRARHWPNVSGDVGRARVERGVQPLLELPGLVLGARRLARQRRTAGPRRADASRCLIHFKQEIAITFDFLQVMRERPARRHAASSVGRVGPDDLGAELARRGRSSCASNDPPRPRPRRSGRTCRSSARRVSCRNAKCRRSAPTASGSGRRAERVALAQAERGGLVAQVGGGARQQARRRRSRPRTRPSRPSSPTACMRSIAPPTLEPRPPRALRLRRRSASRRRTLCGQARVAAERLGRARRSRVG